MIQKMKKLIKEEEKAAGKGRTFNVVRCVRQMKANKFMRFYYFNKDLLLSIASSSRTHPEPSSDLAYKKGLKTPRIKIFIFTRAKAARSKVFYEEKFLCVWKFFMENKNVSDRMVGKRTLLDRCHLLQHRWKGDYLARI